MGCLKLTYNQAFETPLKVVYRTTAAEQKSVQRFLNVDPLAHLRVEWSPYNAMRNNPILNIDPTGALDTKYQDEEGNELGETNDGNDATVTIANEHLDKFKQEFGSAKSAGTQDGMMYNESWTRRFGKDLSFEPGAKVQSWSVKAIAPDADLSGLSSATGGFLLAGATQILDGSSVRFFRSSGTIFSPKLYTSGWTGGSRGNIKTYGTSSVSSVLKWTGRGIGIYNMGSNINSFANGNMSGFQFAGEFGTSAYSTFGGLYGAAWGLGWEGGRAIAQTKPYLDFKFWFQKDVLGWDVQRWQMCTACPK